MYSKNLLEKFKNIKSESTESNLLKSISINNLFNNDFGNNSKINGNDNSNDTINLKSNISINNQNINNQVNFPSQNNLKNYLFQPQNNTIGLGSNCIYNNYTGIIQNTQNDIFMNQIPNILNIPNNLNLNSFYSGTKNIQNNFGNEIRLNIFGDMDNKKSLESTNIPFYQLPLQNPISMTQIPNNIIPNNIPNNFLITNNTNINANTNINKNINNNINFETKNIINKNINNNITINSSPNPKIITINNNKPNNNLKNENIKKENNNNIINKGENSNIKVNSNPKIIFSSKICNNTNKNKVNDQPKNTNENVPKKNTTPLFNIKEIPLNKEKPQKIELTSKKRKRFIKNNKLIFVKEEKEKEKKDTNNKKGESEENEENKNEVSLNSELMSELMQKNTKPRGSRYRGVSKNGSQWQVLIMVKKKKRYLGSFSNEEKAARAYDKVALQHHGIKAKTNYDYTKEEIKKIMNGPKLLKLE